MKVTIKLELLNKLWCWTDEARGEISGMGRLIQTKEGYEIVNLYLLEQECTGSSTDIDAAALAKLMYTSKDDSGSMSLWWHTHANMGVFWSGTDQTTIRELSSNGMILALVVNKKHEYKCKYAQMNCIPYADIEVDDIPMTCIGGIDAQVEEFKKKLEEENKKRQEAFLVDWKKELEAKVKDKVYEVAKEWTSTNKWNKGMYQEEEYAYDRYDSYDDKFAYPKLVAPEMKEGNLLFNISKQTKAVQDECAKMYIYCFKCNAKDIEELDDFFNMYYEEMKHDYRKEMAEKQKETKSEKKRKDVLRNERRTGGKTSCKYHYACGSEANCSRCVGFDKPINKGA